jgi:prepilin signal peptidase PulO-like enzyme (type II secretory pathway)
MFAAVAELSPVYIVCGIIWALVLGLTAGNYACSLVHRLPRGKLLLDKAPYCGQCGTLLGVKDLFPVISALLLKHRCRYCGTPFPTSHTWTEALVALLFILAFFRYGFTEYFLLVVLIGVFLITLAAIEANDGTVMGKVLLCIAVPAMVYRTLLDGTIYNFFSGGFFGLIIGAAVQYSHIKKTGHIYALPVLAYVLAVGGISVGLQNLPGFLALFAVLYLVCRVLKLPLTVAFGVSVLRCVLYL